MDKFIIMIVCLLIGFYSWIAYYGYTHQGDNKRLDNIRRDVSDINAYITDLKVNWINVTITNK